MKDDDQSQRTPKDIQMRLLNSSGKPMSSARSSQESMSVFQEGSPPPWPLNRPLQPLHLFLTVVGVGPQTFNRSTSEFEVSWKSLSSFITVLNCCFTTGLMTATALCMIFTFTGDEVRPHEEARVASIKLMGVIIMCGYLLNSWVQSLNAVFCGRRLCRILNTWNELGSSTEILQTKGVHRKSCMQVGFMILFIIAMMVATLIGKPTLIPNVLDALSVDMYLIPRAWVSPDNPIIRKVIHVAVSFVSLHHFAINKGTAFSFTTHCYFLKTGFMTWNANLTQALEDIWEKREEDCLQDLVQSRRKLVQMVRTTEAVFSSILQCYFATTVVIVCTELYLLAQRIKSEDSDVDEIVTLCLFTLQTTSLLVHVSLAAGSVQEQAEASADVLLRGLPLSATEADKFFMEEITRSVSVVPVYITGGNFYTINKAFILTVVSVVASYFIVILQFMHSCNTTSNSTIESLYNITLNDTIES